MAIDVRELRGRTLDPEVSAELDTYEATLGEYLVGDLDPDVFRVFRLTHGIYGQRQGGHHQMVRVKVPHGRLDPEQLEVLAHVADGYSRGWGHLTTRQNVQFHFVALERTPEVLRLLASVGLTTREACGDTVRNVAACHLAGACPFEVLDVTPWAEATTRHLLRHPYAQRLPRKFKVNFSGCATDCGQAMFNDVGVVAVRRPHPDGTVEDGFRVFVAGGLGANPHPALALEEFTPREDLLPTVEAVLRTFDHDGNRDNKLRARMKWLVDTLGIDEVRRRVLRERRFLRAVSGWPGGIPAVVAERGDAPAGDGAGGAGTPDLAAPVRFRSADPFQRWVDANVVRGAGPGAGGPASAIAHAPLGDLTAGQFRAVADLQRELGLDVRVTNRQNLVLRDVREEDLRTLHGRLTAMGMATPGAELARDVVSCPGADTCNLAVTQSRGLAQAIGAALEDAGLADVGGVRVNISGCTNSCGQHHVADIGLFGLERRAHGRSAPGYQLLLGGRLGETEVEFGRKAVKLPAKAAAQAVVEVVGRFAADREVGRPSVAGSSGPEVPRRWVPGWPTWPSCSIPTTPPACTWTSARPVRTSSRPGRASAPPDRALPSPVPEAERTRRRTEMPPSTEPIIPRPARPTARR
ncbi:MAG: nitrite/sulfite reductase [Acidimicrobiia bacterium]|nr:nitrite/sulfite reductase [Acidimicrobiia bacterium]